MVKLPVDFRCPHEGCGREGGYVKLKIETKKIAKDERPKSKPIWDFITNFKAGEESVERIQHRHPYKHLSIFGVLHPDKKPIINPPKPKPADESNELSRKTREIAKGISLSVKMTPLACQKYPFLEGIARELELAGDISHKYLKSMIDYRWRRSLTEWQLIAEYAKENTPKEASKKYLGIRSDGKYEYLSPGYIKQKIPEVEDFWKKFECYSLPYFLACCRTIMNVVSSDPELMEIYKKYENDFDNKRKKEEERKRQNQSEQQQEEQKSSNGFYQYKREIFVIIHYDGELRKQQKLQQNLDGKKRKADGKIEHKVKETDLPPDVVEELRRNKGEIKYENNKERRP